MKKDYAVKGEIFLEMGASAAMGGSLEPTLVPLALGTGVLKLLTLGYHPIPKVWCRTGISVLKLVTTQFLLAISRN